jgi:SAM-dependent methyltransferase
MSTNLADQQYWDDSYAMVRLGIAAPEDQVRQWIEKHLPRGEGTAFEVGCFPGQYLSVIGKLGYELNGVDLTPRVETELPEWLRTDGYKVGKFLKKDFLGLKTGPLYDVVCSFGFIEHFQNWEEVLGKQCAFVRKGGVLIVTAPNFRTSVQHALHAWLDSENLRRHHLPAMDPTVWAEVVKSHGFSISSAGFFGRFDFWVDQQERSKLQRLALSGLRRLKKPLAMLPEDSPLYSPYCGLVAIKDK